MPEEKGWGSRRNGFVHDSGEATAVGMVVGPPGTSCHRSSSRNTSRINSITAMFHVFERMEACECEGTRRHADRSANDCDRVRHGFGPGDLRGARQELAEGTQIGGRTAEHISSATLHAAHSLRDNSAQSPCGSHRPRHGRGVP